MSILIEGYGVIVRRTDIEQKYSGGWEAYRDNCPNQTFCFHKNLTRVLFMAEEDVKQYLLLLADSGLTPQKDGKAYDVAVVDWVKGFQFPCDWLCIGKWQERMVVWEQGDGEPGTIVMLPHETESTIQKIDSEQLKSTYDFVKMKEGVECWRHKLTGQMIYIGRTSKVDRQEFKPTLKPGVQKSRVPVGGRNLRWGPFPLEEQVMGLGPQDSDAPDKPTGLIATLFKPFRKRAPPKDSYEMDKVLSQLEWIPAEQNSWSIPVLDCRILLTEMIFDTMSQKVAENFSISRLSTGIDVPGRVPDTISEIKVGLEYPFSLPAAEGVVFRAREMENKWDVFRFGKRLFFCSSWTGCIPFVAIIDPDHRGGMRVKKILYDYATTNKNPFFFDEKSGDVSITPKVVTCYVDFLIKGLVGNCIVPAGILSESDANPTRLGLFAWAVFGRLAQFVTLGNTVGLTKEFSLRAEDRAEP